MRLADRWSIIDVATRELYRPEVTYDYSRQDPRVVTATWTEDPFAVPSWKESYVDWRLAEPGRLPRGCDGRLLGKVRTPACGCCGATLGRDGLRLVAYHDDVFNREWRCERHVGRNPCCIAGCGKTFAHKGREDYGTTFMCGAHWRQAPKYMRDAVARIVRIGKRRGWTDALAARHSRLWNRTRTAIVEGRRLDMTEINAMFGWTDDGL